MNNKSYIDTILEFNPLVALFFTFTLNEKVVKKIADSTGATLLFIHDYRYGVTLDENYDSRVLCLPVYHTWYFHSKLALLIDDNHAKLITGSMNLTVDSLSSSKDVFGEMDIEFKCRIYTELSAHIKCILRDSKRINKVETAIEVLEKRLSAEGSLSTKNNTDSEFVSNRGEAGRARSIWEQLMAKVQEAEIKSIRIITPFVKLNYQYQEFIEFLNRKLNKSPENLDFREVHYYLRNNKKVPNVWKSSNVYYFRPKKSTDPFHFKSVIIELINNKVVYFIGSANFTQEGFFSVVESGEKASPENPVKKGNYECGLIVTAPNNPFSDYLKINWGAPLSPEEILESDKSEDEDENENSTDEDAVYFTASRPKYGENVILCAYLPRTIERIRVDKKNIDPSTFNRIGVEQGGQLKHSNGLGPGMYSRSFVISKSKKDIEITVDDNTCTVAIFEESDYIIRLNSMDPLFGYRVEDYRSRLASAGHRNKLDKHSIRVGTGANIITDPPLLEEFYKEIKLKCQSIAREKSLHGLHFDQLENELKKDMEDNGINLALRLFRATHFYKQFKARPDAERFSKRCKEEIDQLVEKYKFNSSYDRFLNTWIK